MIRATTGIVGRLREWAVKAASLIVDRAVLLQTLSPIQNSGKVIRATAAVERYERGLLKLEHS